MKGFNSMMTKGKEKLSAQTESDYEAETKRVDELFDLQKAQAEKRHSDRMDALKMGMSRQEAQHESDVKEIETQRGLYMDAADLQRQTRINEIETLFDE